MKRVLILGVAGAILLVAAGALTHVNRGREAASVAQDAGEAALAPTAPRSPTQAQAATVPDSRPRSAVSSAESSIASPAASPAASVREPDGTEPSFDVVRVNPAGDAVIAGRAAPDAEVTVYDGSQAIGTVTADRRGEWVLLPEQPLAPGNRELSLAARTPGDEVETPSETVVVLAVPDPSAGTGTIAVEMPRTGHGPSTVLQSPPVRSVPSRAVPSRAEPVRPTPAQVAALPDRSEMPAEEPGLAEELVARKPGGVTVDIVDYSEVGSVNVGGRADPGAGVQVYLDNVLVGRAGSDRGGKWRLSPEQPVEPGRYTLRADQVDGEGRVTARAEIPFQMTDLPPDLNPGQSIVVQPGNSLWRIARRTYGAGVQYSVIYEANQTQIRDPDLIYPGQIFKLPEQAAAY